MAARRYSLVLLLCVCVFAIPATAQQRKSLTNQDVTDMVKQGLEESVILKVIQASDSQFDVSSGGVANLQSSGVSAAIIDAMSRAAGANVPVSATSASSNAALISQPTPDANAGKVLLREGTEIPLKFANDLSSKTASDGDAVELLLDGDLKVGDVLVARSGAHAVATISNAKKAGMMGKPGELNIQLQHLTAGENRVRVRGTKGREGDSKTGTAVALTVLFGPIGLIKHGKNVEVKAGTPITAFVDQDIWLPPAN